VLLTFRFWAVTHRKAPSLCTPCQVHWPHNINPEPPPHTISSRKGATLFCLIAGSSSANCCLHVLSAYLLTPCTIHSTATRTCLDDVLVQHDAIISVCHFCRDIEILEYEDEGAEELATSGSRTDKAVNS